MELENESDLVEPQPAQIAAQPAAVINSLAVQDDAARACGDNAADDVQESRLARARGAEHGEELALGDLEIDAVDIDPEVVRLARKYFGVPDNPRYRTHVGDGRLFIESAKDPWDHIMLDAFRGVFVPYHLKTREAYQACLDKLTPGGVVVANLHNLTRMYPHDRNTLAAVFPHRYSFVSESGNQTTFVASAAQQRAGTFAIRDNAREVAKRFDFDVMGLAARYYIRSDWDVGASVLTDDFKPGDLETAAERHNTTCIAGCTYPAR